MGNGFAGLWHYAVIRSYNNNCEVSDFGTPGTHCGKSFVTWSIQKGDLAIVVQCNLISTDVLGYASCLAGNYILFAYVVQK